MSKIARSEYATIQRMVDVEERKVAEVAKTYGCTPAAIYAVLNKLRVAAPRTQPRDVNEPAAAPPAVAGELFAAPAVERPAPKPASAPPAAPASARPVAPVPVPAAPVSSAPAFGATVTELPRRKAGGIGAKLAKPGFGLTMRTSDGEDSVTPFKSLEDLLSAVKPILRSAARSAEPIWFCVQPIDLSEIDMDAA